MGNCPACPMAMTSVSPKTPLISPPEATDEELPLLFIRQPHPLPYDDVFYDPPQDEREDNLPVEEKADNLLLLEGKADCNLPEIYHVLFHPEKSLVDILLSLIIWLFIPFHLILRQKQQPSTPNADQTATSALWNEKQIQIAQRIRHVYTILSGATIKAYLDSVFPRGPNKDSFLVETVLEIPNRPTLWMEWGLCDYKIPAVRPDGIQVVLFTPNYLSNQTMKSTDCDGGGGKSNNLNLLAKLPTHVEIIVFLHGGGLTLSNARNSAVIRLYTAMLKKIKEASSSVTDNNSQARDAVLLSVEYSLAPEHAFPAATLEVMTVMTYLLETFPTRSFHIGGISAGAYLATVTTMELHRHFPNRIATALLISPMLEPTADSLSYYQNSKSSVSCPVHFLRWCWRVYLQLPQVDYGDDWDEPSTNRISSPPTTKTKKRSNKSLPEDPLDSLLAQGSNRAAWQYSQWNGTTLERVIRPLAVDIPIDLRTRFVITTNRGDPLKDEGVALVHKLRRQVMGGGHVEYLDFGGSHCIGITTNPAAYQTLIDAWVELVFPTDSLLGTMEKLKAD